MPQSALLSAPRAVLYLRLSSADDASTSIARQEADLRAHCERHGWVVAEVLTDDGISGRRVRANAMEALRMLRDREADVLLVWKLDRWGRRGAADVADLVAVLDGRRDARFVALQDGLDSTQQAWRLIASVLSEVGRAEAENTATRVRSSIAHRRLTVGAFVGGRVPFGYRPATLEGVRSLVPDGVEAPVVREGARRLLAGGSPTAVCRWLAVEGVPTALSPARRARQAGEDPADLPRGSWYVTTIRKVWGGDPIAGRVMHAGALLSGPDGLPLQRWEPLVDVPTLWRLRSALGLSPSGAVETPREYRRRAARLLSGLAFCATCGRRLYVRHKGTAARPVVAYACPAGREGAYDCTSPSIVAEPLERFVAERYLRVVGDWPEVQEVEFRSGDGSADALLEAEEALRSTTAALTLDGADVPALVARLGVLKDRRSALRAAPQSVERVVSQTGRTWAEAWAATSDVAVRRRYLESAIDHVAISPRLVRGPGFEPARVTVRWREDATGDDRLALDAYGG